MDNSFGAQGMAFLDFNGLCRFVKTIPLAALLLLLLHYLNLLRELRLNAAVSMGGSRSSLWLDVWLLQVVEVKAPPPVGSILKISGTS